LIEDGRNIPDAQVLNTQICVIGAGAAGITLALELAGRGLDVILLEAGGLKADKASCRDLDGEIASKEHHAPLFESRSRQLGGTTAQWVGRCLPLDPIDLERRDYLPGSGWPIEWRDLERWYPRANAYCHAGACAYTLAGALPDAPGSLVPGFRDGALIGSHIERWSLPTHFGRHHRRALAVSKKIRVLLYSICTEIDFDPEHRRITTVSAATTPERRFQVRAQTFVLAGGGLETTRLLLASNKVETSGIGNRHGHLGRYYMGHVFGSVAEIRFHGNPRGTIYGLERDADGVFCRRRIWLAPQTQKKEGLLNTAFWPSNPPAGNPDHRSGILSAAYLALSLPYLRDRLAAPVIRKMFIGDVADRRWWLHLRNILVDLPRATHQGTHFLYRRLVTQRHIPALFVRSPTNRYDLSYHAEQSPNRDSRVVLADAVDRFGMPRLRVDLRYRFQDIDSVVRAHDVLAREMQDRQGVASIRYKRSDVYGHILEQASDGYHQIGTTRMAANERDGVVNEDCRVHDTQNLYVCSSSVFPTSGHANPTLTIVALAVRLGLHISRHSQRT
jgi:choline dehydrogenase-like flavoprotein